MVSWFEIWANGDFVLLFLTIALCVALGRLIAAEHRFIVARKAVPGAADDGKADRESFSFETTNVNGTCVAPSDQDWFISQVARAHKVENRPEEARAFAAAGRDKEVISDALESLRRSRVVAELEADDIECLHWPLDDVELARLLVASDWDVRHVEERLRRSFAFRRKVRGGVAPTYLMPGREPTRLLGAFSVPFLDKQGRPVVWCRLKDLDPATPLEDSRLFFRSIMDAIILHLLSARAKSPGAGPSRTNPLEQYVLVVETEGASSRNVDLRTLSMLVEESEDNYPDRLQEVLVLGSSLTANAVWGVAARLMHRRTRRKVSLVPRSSVNSVLQGMVGTRHLPSTFGGRAKPFPKPEEACDLSDLVGAVVAQVWQDVGFGLSTSLRVPSPDKMLDAASSPRRVAAAAAGGGCFAGCFRCLL